MAITSGVISGSPSDFIPKGKRSELLGEYVLVVESTPLFPLQTWLLHSDFITTCHRLVVEELRKNEALNSPFYLELRNIYPRLSQGGQPIPKPTAWGF